MIQRTDKFYQLFQETADLYKVHGHKDVHTGGGRQYTSLEEVLDNELYPFQETGEIRQALRAVSSGYFDVEINKDAYLSGMQADNDLTALKVINKILKRYFT